MSVNTQLTPGCDGIANIRNSLLLSVAIVAGLAGAPAFAQTAQPSTGAEGASDTQLEEIVVTATRRSADSQRVPLTLQAVTSESIQRLNITSVQKLTGVVPGLQIAPSGGNNLYLRGVGTTSGGYNEAQVAVYVDGLYLANPSMGLYSFNNIDQVEVLKGPQGTLYGRNVTGGLIAITTRDPGADPRVDAEVQYGNYDTFTGRLYASVPLTPTLGANIAVYRSKQGDGWGRNIITGNDISKTSETGVEAKLQWKPTDDTKVTGTFIFNDSNRTSGLAWQIVPGRTGSDGSAYQGRYNIAARIDPVAPFKSYVGLLKIQQDLGFANFTSITGYQKSHQFVQSTSNSASLNTTILELRQKNRSWSQEFQLASAESGDRFDWLLGAFYYNDHTEIANRNYGTCVGSTCVGRTPSGVTGRPKTESISAFADASYKIFDATKLTVGLRYTDETKRLSGFTFALQGRPNSAPNLSPACSPTQPAPCTVYQPGDYISATVPPIPTKLHFNQLTYRVVLSQDLGEHIHAYVSHNLGFKSGAFNANVFTNPPAKPEKLYATEVGIKSELFDRKLRLNVAYFHYTFKDVQLRSTAPPAPPGFAILSNVGAEKMDGIDADFSFVLARGLVINGGMEYLKAKYAKYPGTTCSSPGSGNVGVVSVPCDLSGRRVALSSPFSATLGFNYSLETSMGTWAVGANLKHDDARPLTADGSVRAQSSNLIDANLSWTSPDKRFDVRLFGRNLTKKFTLVNAFVAPGDFAFLPGEPRTYGLAFGVHF